MDTTGIEEITTEHQKRLEEKFYPITYCKMCGDKFFINRYGSNERFCLGCLKEAEGGYCEIRIEFKEYLTKKIRENFFLDNRNILVPYKSFMIHRNVLTEKFYINNQRKNSINKLLIKYLENSKGITQEEVIFERV